MMHRDEQSAMVALRSGLGGRLQLLLQECELRVADLAAGDDT